MKVVSSQVITLYIIVASVLPWFFQAEQEDCLYSSIEKILKDQKSNSCPSSDLPIGEEEDVLKKRKWEGFLASVHERSKNIATFESTLSEAKNLSDVVVLHGQKTSDINDSTSSRSNEGGDVEPAVSINEVGGGREEALQEKILPYQRAIAINARDVVSMCLSCLVQQVVARAKLSEEASEKVLLEKDKELVLELPVVRPLLVRAINNIYVYVRTFYVRTYI